MKKYVSFIGDLAVGGAAMQMVGSNMGGSLGGIGKATNTMIAGGLLGKANKLWRK